jgi:hypothetical protein
VRGLRHLLGVGFVYVAPGRQASGMIHGGSRSNDDVIQVGKPGGDGVVIFVFAGVGGGRHPATSHLYRRPQLHQTRDHRTERHPWRRSICRDYVS